MREICSYGSVGEPGNNLPGSTRTVGINAFCDFQNESPDEITWIPVSPHLNCLILTILGVS